MSRIRTVKPEFWVSEQIIACSPLARLLFIGMFNFCDDNGIHPKSYVSIKAEIFPGDDIKIDEIQSWVGELIQNSLIHEYVVEEKWYWLITGWKKHQRIDRPTSRHPLPQSSLRKIEDYSASTPRMLEEYSERNLRSVDNPSATDRNGKEGNGGDVNICEVETSHVGSFNNENSAITQIFQHWKTVMNHQCAKLDKKRTQAINNALGLGYSIDDLQQAIDGCFNTPFNMGKNDRQQVYDDITLIFRDATHIERFINNANTSLELDNPDGVMAGVI